MKRKRMMEKYIGFGRKGEKYEQEQVGGCRPGDGIGKAAEKTNTGQLAAICDAADSGSIDDYL